MLSLESRTGPPLLNSRSSSTPTVLPTLDSQFPASPDGKFSLLGNKKQTKTLEFLTKFCLKALEIRGTV
jgi:hypothetical protein